MKILEPLIAASLMTVCVAAWADKMVGEDNTFDDASSEDVQYSSPEKIGDKFEGTPDKEAVREDSPTVSVASPDAP